METFQRLTNFVENKDFDGLLDAIAKKLRSLNSDSPYSEISMEIRLLSEFGLFLLHLDESPFNDETVTEHVFKMAQKIDAIMEHHVDVRTVFVNVMGKISNYAFKTEYASKRGLMKMEDINAYLDGIK